MKINTRQKFWTYRKGWVANLLLSLLEGKEKREIWLTTLTLSKRRKNNQFFRKTRKNIKSFSWGFPGGPGVKAALPFQGVWVQSLVGEVSWAAKCSKKKKLFLIFGYLTECSAWFFTGEYWESLWLMSSPHLDNERSSWFTSIMSFSAFQVNKARHSKDNCGSFRQSTPVWDVSFSSDFTYRKT